MYINTTLHYIIKIWLTFKLLSYSNTLHFILLLFHSYLCILMWIIHKKVTWWWSNRDEAHNPKTLKYYIYVLQKCCVLTCETPYWITHRHVKNQILALRNSTGRSCRNSSRSDIWNVTQFMLTHASCTKHYSWFAYSGWDYSVKRSNLALQYKYTASRESKLKLSLESHSIHKALLRSLKANIIINFNGFSDCVPLMDKNSLFSPPFNMLVGNIMALRASKTWC
jgi:hypothetical protein